LQHSNGKSFEIQVNVISPVFKSLNLGLSGYKDCQLILQKFGSVVSLGSFQCSISSIKNSLFDCIPRSNGDIVIHSIFDEATFKFKDLVISLQIDVTQEEVDEVIEFVIVVPDLLVDVVPNDHSGEHILDFVQIFLEEEERHRIYYVFEVSPVA
jgi:hypothetical protein